MMMQSYDEANPKGVKERPCDLCSRLTPAWALYRKDDNWKCGQCLIDATRVEAVPELSWADVRAKRDQMLSALDWTQLPDVDQAVQGAARETRQRLRDITDYETPALAWDALNSFSD
jgi:hypothetical protein